MDGWMDGWMMDGWVTSQQHTAGMLRKIDNCGSSTNVSYWAELLNATGKAIRTSILTNISNIELCKSWLLVILVW